MHLAMRLHLAAARKKAKKPAPKTIALPPVAEDYEELSDGSFKCLHCGKIYQPSSRAESYVQKHVTKEHL